uniref:AT02866p n=1 Tax=Drosophila melanogaster TaxID=7227 RepID=Q8T4J0_DROME|nr:AT02866p [Drosophila melanogaster]
MLRRAIVGKKPGCCSHSRSCASAFWTISWLGFVAACSVWATSCSTDAPAPAAAAPDTAPVAISITRRLLLRRLRGRKLLANFCGACCFLLEFQCDRPQILENTKTANFNINNFAKNFKFKLLFVKFLLKWNFKRNYNTFNNN